MIAIPELRPITAPVRRLHPDTLRECALIVTRTNRLLTAAEKQELAEITERQNARAYAADLAHERMTEAHAFPTNSNLHDD